MKGIDVYKISRQMKEDGKKNWREWVGEFLQSKLGLECKIVDCQIRGRVIVASLENNDIKKEVMLNKSKLKGERRTDIYRKQFNMGREANTRTIAKWAKEQREKGKEVKIGRGKVKIQDKWMYWEELEKEIEREEEKRGAIPLIDRRKGRRGMNKKYARKRERKKEVMQ